MNDEKKCVIIVANPNSGSRTRNDLIQLLQDELKEQGLAPKLCSNLETLESEIHALHQHGQLLAVVAAGGDGTASAVATRTPTDVPVGILPLGTENLLAKFLKLTCSPKELAQAISDGNTRSIDCGYANGKLFLIMVGIGFDAQVVLEMTRARKGHIHHWSYAIPIVRSILQYRFPELLITASTVAKEVQDLTDTQRWHARWVFVANLPRYAAGLPIADWAASDDGLLDVCTFRGGGIIRSLRYFLYLLFNRHRTLSAFSTHKASHIRIELVDAKHPPVSYQIDGDYGGVLPLDIQVIPNRLRLIAPKEKVLE